MDLRNHTSVASRREFLQKELSVDLTGIGSSSLDDSAASTKNCENMIGFIQVPLGVAGPLEIRSSSKHNETRSYMIPLSTTEGALVASINRGCKAITQSGGALVSINRIGTTRGLSFRVENVYESETFTAYIYEHKADLDRLAKETSSHIELTDVTVKSTGKHVFVRLAFNTQDAMGMNMVTIASDLIAKHITEQTNATCTTIAGNYDIDKKPAWLNVIRGRGFESKADVLLTPTVISDVLKTSPKALYDVWLSKCMIGSAMAGSMGFNAHFANIVAALFLATGQDIAHVSEGSLGMTTCELTEEGVYMSVYLPDLMVGTVGGGTGLPTQKESLALINAGHRDMLTSSDFAGIVAASVLAGEVSLLSSLSQGSLSTAHKRLGRGVRT